MNGMRNSWYGVDRDDRNLLVERVFLISRVDHPEVFQREILNGDLHRTTCPGRVGVLELKAVVFASGAHEQVKFCAAMRRPKVRIAGFKHANDLFHRKALPGCAKFGMRLKVCQCRQLKERMENAAVANIDLGRFDLTLANVFEPGRENSDHVSARENIEIPARRGLRGAERAGKLRCVPDLPMIVRDHRPEASQSLRRDRDAELRNIPFEKGAYEVIAPSHAGGFIRGKKRSWKSAAQPKTGALLRTHFSKVKPGQVYESDAPGKRLRHTSDQVRGSGAEQKESGFVRDPIRQNPQQFEKVGLSLNFVNDHQTSKLLQHPQGRRQSTDVNRILKIEIRAWFALHDHLGQSRLAALARAEESHDRMDTESTGNLIKNIRAWDHVRIISLKILMSSEDFQAILFAISIYILILSLRGEQEKVEEIV